LAENKDTMVDQGLEQMKEDTKQVREILKSARISPTQKRVLSWPQDLLLKHYALIVYKASSLSSKERQLVTERIGYKLGKEHITPEQVSGAVNELTEYLENKLKEKLDDSSSK
jgi:hypothetical protein